jgi:hypothetical protein
MAVKKKLTKKIVAKKIVKNGSKNVAKKPQINIKIIYLFDCKLN